MKRGALGRRRLESAIHRATSLTSEGVALACGGAERFDVVENERLSPYVYRSSVGLFSAEAGNVTCRRCLEAK